MDKLKKHKSLRANNNDVVKWAQKMVRIGNYKEIELDKWHKHATLQQRIAMTEELLGLEDYMVKRSVLALSFLSLSKLLEQNSGKKK